MVMHSLILLLKQQASFRAHKHIGYKTVTGISSHDLLYYRTGKQCSTTAVVDKQDVYITPPESLRISRRDNMI